jgi:hypothetical protein
VSATRSRCLAVLLPLLLAACGSEEESPPTWLGSPTGHRVEGCEAIDHTSCDVRDISCDERLLELAVCLRQGDDAPLPPITVMSESEFADYLYESATEDPPPAINHFERALVVLGLVQTGAFSLDTVVTDLVENVGGVFRHDSDDILIIDHGADSDMDTASNVLVHEFVHYLQDREIDLAAFTETHSLSSDASLAASSVVEGEAELHQVRHYAALLGLDPNSVDFRERFESMVSWSERYLLEQASPYAVRWSVFPYSWGGRYVQAAWENGARDAVLERFASPPAQTRTLMAVKDGIVAEDIEAVTFESPAPPDGFSIYSGDVGGAFMLFLYLATLTTTPDEARALALDWRGDKLSIFSSEADAPDTVVTWRLAFASSMVAERVFFLAGQALPATQVRREGDTVVVLADARMTTNLDWALAPLP